MNTKGLFAGTALSGLVVVAAMLGGWSVGNAEAVDKLAAQAVDKPAAPMAGAPTSFADTLDIDIGNRQVQVKHLGRGNTPGDAIVYLPKEKILVAGDLVVYPIPYTYDGYPAEWIQTLQNLARLDAQTIVPGHGPILHDKTYLYLVGNLLQSAAAQPDARLSALAMLSPEEIAQQEEDKKKRKLASCSKLKSTAPIAVGIPSCQ